MVAKSRTITRVVGGSSSWPGAHPSTPGGAYWMGCHTTLGLDGVNCDPPSASRMRRGAGTVSASQLLPMPASPWTTLTHVTSYSSGLLPSSYESRQCTALVGRRPPGAVGPVAAPAEPAGLAVRGRVEQEGDPPPGPPLGQPSVDEPPGVGEELPHDEVAGQRGQHEHRAVDGAAHDLGAHYSAS